jgi:hypothetical protein
MELTKGLLDRNNLDFVRVDGQLSKSSSIKKDFLKIVPSHLFCLISSLMTFLMNVVNMKSHLKINADVEVSWQKALYYVLQQDLNLKNC